MSKIKENFTNAEVRRIILWVGVASGFLGGLLGYILGEIWK